jgi:hydrogenase nickel incorporation protein HypA/HybF
MEAFSSPVRPGLDSREEPMHELSVTQGILDIALDYANRNQATKIVEIQLQIGEITDFQDEWMQRYFDFVSKGTIAEGAVLKISRVPAQLQCAQCAAVFPLDRRTWSTECPSCHGKETSLISGREFRVESLQVI